MATICRIARATVRWISGGGGVPPLMKTVLVARQDSIELALGYWDGDAWYTTAGEPIGGVEWWCVLPAVPASRAAAREA